MRPLINIDNIVNSVLIAKTRMYQWTLQLVLMQPSFQSYMGHSMIWDKIMLQRHIKLKYSGNKDKIALLIRTAIVLAIKFTFHDAAYSLQRIEPISSFFNRQLNFSYSNRFTTLTEFNESSLKKVMLNWIPHIPMQWRCFSLCKSLHSGKSIVFGKAFEIQNAF